MEVNIRHLLIHRVDIMRCTIVAGDIGERRVYEIANSQVPARVQPMTSKEVSDFSRRGLDASTQVQLDVDYNLTEKTFIQFDNRVLEIVGIVNWQNADKMWTAYCRDKTPT